MSLSSGFRDSRTIKPFLNAFFTVKGTSLGWRFAMLNLSLQGSIMKRNQFFALGTVAGIAGTTLLTAGASTVGNMGALSASGQSPSHIGTGQSVVVHKVKATVAKSRTAVGNLIYVNFGYVQVKVIAKGKHIVDVKTIKSPDGAQYSVMIAQQSIPLLRQQALAAQSAKIQGVSGASYTSYGFQKSLQSALNKLGI